PASSRIRVSRRSRSRMGARNSRGGDIHNHIIEVAPVRANPGRGHEIVIPSRGNAQDLEKAS
ncbi:MAG: hypothetical protein OEQ25_13965, partial [Gammaproteobacteria bacterium]|nr:hypothetical protein [Gammaproteobacteria bacterium]